MKNLMENNKKINKQKAKNYILFEFPSEMQINNCKILKINSDLNCFKSDVPYKIIEENSKTLNNKILFVKSKNNEKFNKINTFLKIYKK